MTHTFIVPAKLNVEEWLSQHPSGWEVKKQKNVDGVYRVIAEFVKIESDELAIMFKLAFNDHISGIEGKVVCINTDDSQDFHYDLGRLREDDKLSQRGVFIDPYTFLPALTFKVNSMDDDLFDFIEASKYSYIGIA